jgi:hypothetical protein
MSVFIKRGAEGTLAPVKVPESKIVSGIVTLS